MISYILALVLGAFVLVVDQYTKFYIVSNFTLGQDSKFINGIIDIVYIHNRGGAWGVLEGYTWWLLALTVVIMIICVALMFKLGAKNKFIFWSISLILFGGIGNLIDRVFRDGNVIDFLHFEFFPQFPVFNVADCAIVVGVVILMAYFIFDTIKEFRQKSFNHIVEKLPKDENN